MHRVCEKKTGRRSDAKSHHTCKWWQEYVGFMSVCVGCKNEKKVQAWRKKESEKAIIDANKLPPTTAKFRDIWGLPIHKLPRGNRWINRQVTEGIDG